MIIPVLDIEDRSAFRLDRGLQWWDRDTACTLVMSAPATDPQLWDEYLEGAERSYRKHGVERALDIDTIRSGHDTVLFWAAIDPAGEVVAGVRAKGPLQCAEDSHALVEWSGRPGEQAVRKMITDRLPFGVIEMKSAWTTDKPGHSGRLTKLIARSGFHAMPLLDNQFCMATGSTHVLERWRSSGGVLASAIPATPYPDERYRTKMMWWDRRNFTKHADADQVSKILLEVAEIGRRLRRLSVAGTASPRHEEVL